MPVPARPRILVFESAAGDPATRDILATFNYPCDLASTDTRDSVRQLLAHARSRPDLLIIDFGDRSDVLDLTLFIRNDKDLRRLPVIVVGAVGNPEDMAAAYHAGANAFVEKSTDIAAYRETLGDLLHFWTQTVVLPPRPKTEGLKASAE